MPAFTRVPSLRRHVLGLTVAAACCAGLASAAPPPGERSVGPAAARASLATLDGRWASTAPEPWGPGAWGTREFTFRDGRWTLRFVLALDPAMRQPVFAFRTHGTYALGGASASVPGAWEADFREDAKHVTLLTSDPALAAAFGLAACGLEVGVERDVSSQGCARWKPVSVCPDDHDLLALGPSGALYFGVRPADNDLCTPDRRPRALLPAVVRRP